jgi:methyltransferase-like protein
MSVQVQLHDVFRQADNIVTRKVMDETLLVPIAGDLASMENLYTLNSTGAFIWQALDGRRSLEEIRTLLVEEYAAPVAVIEADLLELVEELAAAKLLLAVWH